jgi:AraC family transcriptional activator of pobA
MDQQSATDGLAVQHIESKLHQTLWRLAEPGSHARVFILLEDGEGWLDDRAKDLPEKISSPSFHWLVRAEGLRLRAEAGSTGYIGSVSEAFLAQLSAGHADAAMLGFAANSDHHLELNNDAEREVVAILGSLHRELDSPRVGFSIVVAAQLRILLITMLRLAGLDSSFEGAGSEARFLQRFRELVEANFRARWTVKHYAEHIGISHDRLHSLCSRRLGRTPKALIAERVAREAALGLERSTMSLEQLSYSLGFRDPAHFSHFFKRVTGISPGAHRRRSIGSNKENQRPSVTFADWP